MKYLTALLKEEEISLHPRKEEPTKPIKPVSSVLSGARRRNIGETEPAPATDAKRFVARHVPHSALTAFPDWQGLLIKSSVLEMSMWIVRSRKDGEELARETGQPALLLDDVLGQKG